MAKYILKSIDTKNDSFDASVTYEFESDEMSSMTFHLAQFLRSAGYTWVEDIQIVKNKNIDIDPFAAVYGFDDETITNSVLNYEYGVGGLDRDDEMKENIIRDSNVSN